MEEIMDLAARLGRAITASRQFQALKQLEFKAREDPRIQEITAAYQKQIAALRELEKQGKPIEPEDKRKLAELRDRVQALPDLQALLRVQADYTELMLKVNDIISAELKIDADDSQ